MSSNEENSLPLFDKTILQQQAESPDASEKIDKSDLAIHSMLVVRSCLLLQFSINLLLLFTSPDVKELLDENKQE